MKKCIEIIRDATIIVCIFFIGFVATATYMGVDRNAETLVSIEYHSCGNKTITNIPSHNNTN